MLRLVLSNVRSQKRRQCTFDSSLAREYTIEDPKREAPLQGSAPLGSKEAILKKRDVKEVPVPKRGQHNPVNGA